MLRWKSQHEWYLSLEIVPHGVCGTLTTGQFFIVFHYLWVKVRDLQPQWHVVLIWGLNSRYLTNMCKMFLVRSLKLLLQDILLFFILRIKHQYIKTPSTTAPPADSKSWLHITFPDISGVSITLTAEWGEEIFSITGSNNIFSTGDLIWSNKPQDSCVLLLITVSTT